MAEGSYAAPTPQEPMPALELLQTCLQPEMWSESHRSWVCRDLGTLDMGAGGTAGRSLTTSSAANRVNDHCPVVARNTRVHRKCLQADCPALCPGVPCAPAGLCVGRGQGALRGVWAYAAGRPQQGQQPRQEAWSAPGKPASLLASCQQFPCPRLYCVAPLPGRHCAATKLL